MSPAVVFPVALTPLVGNGMEAVRVRPLERHLQGVRAVWLLKGKERPKVSQSHESEWTALMWPV